MPIDLDDVQFRPARRGDCRAIASLYSISSDGVADYIWTKIAEPSEDMLDVGRRRYEREGSVFSYTSCTVATLGDQVIGMLVAFPMEVEPGGAVEDDPVLAPYAKLEEDQSYYICGVAVDEAHRGRGIGTRFLEIAEQHAAEKQLAKLSLIVFEQNAAAKRLYDRHGYREVAREPIFPHELIHYTGDAVLMVKQIA